MRTPDMTFASGRKSVREQHARSAFGVVQVPMGGVEIALVAEVASVRACPLRQPTAPASA